AINVRGCWLGLKYVLPVMYARKSGSIINTSSVGGLVAGPMPVSPYVASKFAIHGLTRVVANEAAPYQVRGEFRPSIAGQYADDALSRKRLRRFAGEHCTIHPARALCGG